jgi:hypothetical protein
MAEGAVHGVELHAIFKVLVGGRKGIGDTGGMSLHGSIHGPICNTPLETGWGDVCVGRNEAKHGKAESTENEYENSNDNTENEFAHGFLREEPLWQMERVGR